MPQQVESSSVTPTLATCAHWPQSKSAKWQSNVCQVRSILVTSQPTPVRLSHGCEIPMMWPAPTNQPTNHPQQSQLFAPELLPGVEAFSQRDVTLSTRTSSKASKLEIPNGLRIQPMCSQPPYVVGCMHGCMNLHVIWFVCVSMSKLVFREGLVGGFGSCVAEILECSMLIRTHLNAAQNLCNFLTIAGLRGLHGTNPWTNSTCMNPHPTSHSF